MRIAALCCLLALGALPAWAEPSCNDCGVVRSVREIQKDLGARDTDVSKPSGLVATVPLGRGPDKPHVGSSQRVGGDAVLASKNWEVVVVQDDKRVRILMLDSKPAVEVGDRVRFEDGRLVPRMP